MKDGTLNKCKICTKKDVLNYRIENPEKLKNYELKRSQTQKRIDLSTRQAKKWRQMHPEKWSAHIKVNNAIRSGKIHKKPCEVCGDVKSEGHHDNYSRPLDVLWLCSKHHKQRHKELKSF